jgi:transposase
MNSKVLYQEEVREEVEEENLLLDAGYSGTQETVCYYGYVAHIRPRNKEAEQIREDPTYKARRWVVERLFSWLRRFRKLSPRFEKTHLSHCGLFALACAQIIFNKII